MPLDFSKLLRRLKLPGKVVSPTPGTPGEITYAIPLGNTFTDAEHRLTQIAEEGLQPTVAPKGSQLASMHLADLIHFGSPGIFIHLQSARAITDKDEIAWKPIGIKKRSNEFFLVFAWQKVPSEQYVHESAANGHTLADKGWTWTAG